MRARWLEIEMLRKFRQHPDFPNTLEEIRKQSTDVDRERRRTGDIKTSPSARRSEASWKSINIQTLEEPAPISPWFDAEETTRFHTETSAQLSSLEGRSHRSAAVSQVRCSILIRCNPLYQWASREAFQKSTRSKTDCRHVCLIIRPCDVSGKEFLSSCWKRSWLNLHFWVSSTSTHYCLFTLKKLSRLSDAVCKCCIDPMVEPLV